MRLPVISGIVGLCLLSLCGCGSGSETNLVVFTQPGIMSQQGTQQVALIAELITSSGKKSDVSSDVQWTANSSGVTIVGASAHCEKAGSYVVEARWLGLNSSSSLICDGVAKAKPSPVVALLGPVTTPVTDDPPSSNPVSTPPSATSPVTYLPVTATPSNPALGNQDGDRHATALNITNPAELVRSEQPYTFAAMVNYDDGTQETVAREGLALWTVDSPTATVSQSGLVHCNVSGPVKVTAMLGDLEASTSFMCLLRQVESHRGLTDEEDRFDGPFSGWTSVKSFGAKGDGVTDDTVAFQAAVDYMTDHRGVLWVPHGTYILSASVTAWNWQYNLMIGEDPRTTTLVWKGETTGDVILRCASCVEATFKRLTLNGSDNVAVGIRLDGGGSFYPTKTSLQDLHISQVGRDVQIGYAAEISIKRVFFDHPSFAGVSVENFDAGNINVVDSLFVGATWGVTNIARDGGAGSFNVSNCVFIGSVSADLANGNAGVFTGRNNISYNANLFYLSGVIGAPSQITLENNEIISPLADPLEIDNPGTVTLLDNVFRSVPEPYPVLIVKGPLGAAVLAIGNHYEMDNPYTGNITRLSTALEAKAPAGQATYVLPTNVYVPPQSGRTVYEIPPGSSSTAVQLLIEKAIAAGSGVLHVPTGSINVSETLSLHGNADIALVGDGSYSYFGATSALSGPVLAITGSKVEVEDISVASFGEAIRVEVPDNPADSVLCDECHTSFPQNGLVVDSLDNALVEARMSLLNGFTYGVAAHGGPNQKAGRPSMSRVATFMTSSNNYLVDQGAHFTLTDGFHDWHQGAQQFTFTGNGFLTHSGSEILTYQPGGMQISSATGNVTLIGNQIDTTIGTDSTSAAKVFIAGSLQTAGVDPFPAPSPAEHVIHVGDQTNQGNGYPSPIADDTVSPSAVEKALSDARTVTDMPKRSYGPNGVRIRFNKVLVNFASTAFHITSKNSTGVVQAYSITSSASGLGLASCLGLGSGLNTWSLADGGDGSYGLSNGSAFLSQGDEVVQNGGHPVEAAASFINSAQRGFLRPTGDGSYRLINRSSGLALAVAGTSCIAVASQEQDQNEEWAFTH